MSGQKKLVIGASGFVGSHVTRQLVERGDDVRVMIRHTSSTKAFDDLEVERVYGDIFDDDVLSAAMADCDIVFYCVVDARAFLYDPAPLFRTNVEGLRHVLDAALAANLTKFVFTSTMGTIGLAPAGELATEDTPVEWTHLGGDYIKSRVAAEDLVLSYAKDKGLPAVAMCIANTYGPGDWGPTPHGSMLAAAGTGKVPAYPKGAATEVVGIEDTAAAMLLAADHGRVGERYIIAERYLSWQELLHIAADAGGAARPRFGIPKAAMSAVGLIGDAARRVTRRDLPMSSLSVRLMSIMSPMDHSKAERELGWRPAPIHDSIKKAVTFFEEQQQLKANAARG